MSTYRDLVFKKMVYNVVGFFNKIINLPSRLSKPPKVAAGRENVISHTVRKERGTNKAPRIAHPWKMKCITHAIEF